MGGERDQLIKQHLSLVQAIAHKVKQSLRAHIDLEDLVAYGHKGLVEAAERFDPRHGVAFSTFSYYRIRGAMFDGLRTMGWYSRADYARYRAEERANELLRSEAEREGAATASAPDGPSPSTAQAIGELSELLAGIATVHIVSLETAGSLVDEQGESADDSLDRGRLGPRIRAAVARLPEKERQLLELYYFQEKTLEEAGGALGLSKSWACRLHARAITLLRAVMDEGA